MPHFPKAHPSIRAPRTSFSTPEPADFKVADQKLKGSLQRLSITGGCALLEKRIKGGTLAEIEIPTPIGKIRGLIEFLERRATARCPELAFRFVGLNDADYERLAKALAQFGD